MDRFRVARLLGSLLVLSLDSGALAQTVGLGSHQPLPGSASAAATQVQRWFELEAPFSRRLSLSFEIRPTPSYELLQLPTFEGRAPLWRSGRFSLSLFERVAPAVGLECGLTCAPTLERSLGLDARLELTRISRQVPSTFFFVQPAMVRHGAGFMPRTMLGFGGLLDL